MPLHYVEAETLCQFAESRLQRLLTSCEFYGEKATPSLVALAQEALRKDFASIEVSDQIPEWARPLFNSITLRFADRTFGLYSGNLPLHEALTQHLNKQTEGEST